MGNPRERKINPKKELRKKDTLPSEKVKKKPADKTTKEKIASLPTERTTKITEEEIMQLPLIQTLNAGVQEISGKLQGYEAEIKETNEKISALAEAMGILNDEFSKFMQTLQDKLSSTEIPPGNPLLGNSPPGTKTVSTTRVNPAAPEVPPEPSNQDKLLGWANVLSQFMGAGTSKTPTEAGGGVNAGDMIKLVLELQNNAEERALKRQEVSIKNIVELGKLFTSKKIEPSSHLPT